MTIEYCDICGKPITAPFSRYKLKKEWCSWHERGWDRLVVHDDCWRELCKQIKEKKHE